MHRGYIKLWRKTLDSGWLSNHKLCAFWLWCLMKASHKEYDQIVGYQKVHLMPGDFIFGRKISAKELKISERSIRTCLKLLKNSENLTIKTTNKFSIISIVNWNSYQSQEIINDQQNDQQATSKRPASDHKQECKELKECKETIINIPQAVKIKLLESVFLTEEQIKKLRENFKEDFDTAIETLNNYKMQSGKKYKSDYHALIGWVAKELEKKKIKGKGVGLCL